MRWSWNDRRRERESCWKEKKKRRLSCVVSCVCLWIEREWESQKFWELWPNFDLKKEEIDVVFNDSKFDLFVLTFMICFIDLFQSEMILFSSKIMKENFDCENHEFSNWSDDDVEINETNWLEMSVASFDDDDFSNWQNIRVETIQKIVFLNWLKNCVEIDEKIKEWVVMNQCDDDEKKNEKIKNIKASLRFLFRQQSLQLSLLSFLSSSSSLSSLKKTLLFVKNLIFFLFASSSSLHLFRS
jgi:hypothetical protein